MLNRGVLAIPLALALAAMATPSRLAAQETPVVITVDEFGVGDFFINGTHNLITGALLPDPGPGGTPAAMTYDLQNPPSLVPGDLFLLEPPGDQDGLTSDLIRFNAAETVPGYPASLVFYSALTELDVPLPPADGAFPSANYSNVLSINEVDLGDGFVGASYTPGPGQPGFVEGFAATYVFHSDPTTVPEPASLALLASGLAGMGGMFRLRRRA